MGEDSGTTVEEVSDVIDRHGHSKGEWMVYVLASVPRPGRTYCGVTNDLSKRIRQHNGNLVGGARATLSDRPWKLSALVVGFGRGPEAKRAAMRFEWFSKVKNYRGSLASMPTGPMRRMFLLNHAKTMHLVPEQRLEIIVCNGDMLSTEARDARLAEIGAWEERRSTRIVVVEDTPSNISGA
jgi:predicted GIY-YIG superfamily endonuclease